jgi:hypothetical protein
MQSEPQSSEQPNPIERPDIYDAIKQLLEAMRSAEALAFRAGWNACYNRNMQQTGCGFDEAWSKYVDKREGWPQ